MDAQGFLIRIDGGFVGGNIILDNAKRKINEIDVTSVFMFDGSQILCSKITIAGHPVDSTGEPIVIIVRGWKRYVK